MSEEKCPYFIDGVNVRNHAYPAHRQPTGPRPNAGRPAHLVNPVIISVMIEADDRKWLLSQGTISKVIRNLIAVARKGAV